MAYDYDEQIKLCDHCEIKKAVAQDNGFYYCEECLEKEVFLEKSNSLEILEHFIDEIDDVIKDLARENKAEVFDLLGIERLD